MTNLTGVIRALRKERQRVHGEMERLNAALAALGSLGGLGLKAKRSRAPKTRRPMSADARKKIAAAPACTLGKMEEKQAKQVRGYCCPRLFSMLYADLTAVVFTCDYLAIVTSL